LAYGANCVGRKGKKQEQLECGYKDCADCKQGCVNGSKVFCGWLRKFINKQSDDGVEIIICPRFEVEPLEYKVYRRT